MRALTLVMLAVTLTGCGDYVNRVYEDDDAICYDGYNAMSCIPKRMPLPRTDMRLPDHVYPVGTLLYCDGRDCKPMEKPLCPGAPQ